MSSLSGTQALRAAIETMDANTRGSDVTKTIIFDQDGDFKSALFIKGRTTVKIDATACGGDVCVSVSPPAPFRCILADPDSSRRTEMYYEGRKFVGAHVIARNDRMDVPAHIVFHIELWQAADAKCVMARIAERFCARA